MLMVASTLHCEIAVVKLQASARQSAGGYSSRAAVASVAQEPSSSLPMEATGKSSQTLPPRIRSRILHWPKEWQNLLLHLSYIYIYINKYSNEVYKSNFRQYGQMKSRVGQRQREEKDQKREE